MKFFSRKTEFWKTTTPNKVGPGSYEITVSKQSQRSKAPFSRSEKRPTTQKGRETSPGPGSYIRVSKWTAPACSDSQSPRLLPFAPGVTGFVLPSNFDTPGPGTYDLNYIKENSLTVERPKTSKVNPTPPSIPIKPVKPSEVSPAYYNSALKPSTRGVSFGLNSERKDYFPFKQDEPGPGEYNFAQENHDKASWAFSSKSKRIVPLERNSEPGPGSYNPGTESARPKVTVEGFGSTAKRDLPLSKNPHIPYAIGIKPTPGIGTYSTKEDLRRKEKMREKFVTVENPKKRMPFNSSEERTSPWDSGSNPGPGQYFVKEGTTATSKIGQAARFNYKLEESPGPGSYDRKNPVNHTQKESHTFKSKSPRFTHVSDGNVFLIGKQENVELNTGHKNWKRQHSNSVSFNSTTVRQPCFQGIRNTPGPGTYHTRPSTSPVKEAGNLASRFHKFGYYNSKPTTSKDIGPGSYHKQEEMCKKSFNIAPELRKEHPWL